MGVGVLLPFAVIAVVAVVFFRKVAEPERRSMFLRRAGFGLTAFVTFFVGAFIVGETAADPGGWQAVALVAAWLVPLVLLAAVAWYRSDQAVRLFAVLTSAVVGLGVWYALDPGSWRSFEDDNGPVRTVVTFVVTAALALLGLKRTTAAGVLLLVVGIVPVLLASGRGDGLSSLLAVVSAPVVTGVLYLLSVSVARPRPGNADGVEPPVHPTAA